MLRTSDFDFVLPKERIAQTPLAERDQARLMLVPKKGALAHHRVSDLPSLLPPRALIIVNDTKVIPARLFARKPTGGQVELLLVEKIAGSATRQRWRCLGRASKPFRRGRLEIDASFGVDVVETVDEFVIVDFATSEEGLLAFLQRAGQVPLPPYIERPVEKADADRYQTLFAEAPGAVAAPTAGLHFTPALVAALRQVEIEIASITLHVGPGTFSPVRSEEIASHRMHPERFVVSEATAEKIRSARAEHRAIVAVGTTVARTLETISVDGTARGATGSTDIFISPGHVFRGFDALLTNFHLPRSTLLMLVSAFGGRERVLSAYAEAIACDYRFYSYGDAMLIT